MSAIALAAWIVTALGGLFLLAIWLIEYDPDFQRAAATRLPVPVIAGHVVLALGGLAVWVAYLITGNDELADITLADLAIVVTFGLTMAVRWIGVYRSQAPPSRRSRRDGQQGAPTDRPGSDLAVPPERHFPVAVVIGHGLLALTTVTLVLLTTLGVGGS
jgi:hypothetical protein